MFLKKKSTVFAPLLAMAMTLATADSGLAQVGANEKDLRAQEEALLRQISATGVKQQNSATFEISESAIGAENQANDERRVEQLIDEQTRAALAKIDNVKERVAASKVQQQLAIPEVTPFEEETAPVKLNSGVQGAKKVAESFVESVPQEETALAKVTTLSKELGSRDSEISNMKVDLVQAQRRAVAAEGRAAALAKQVESLRAKLMVTETEVERLSGVIEARNRNVISSQAGSAGQVVRTVGNTAGVNGAGNGTVVRERIIVKEGKAAEDLPVVVVTGEKVRLRLGPGQNHTSLMDVTRGTRLVVETKQGNWFRVFAANGARVWISADEVQLQRGGGSL